MLAEAEAQKQAADTAATRKLQVGSCDRSQRIRTYIYPQGRITDHRVEGLTLYDLPNVLEGALDPLVERLSQEHQADELARLTDGGQPAPLLRSGRGRRPYLRSTPAPLLRSGRGRRAAPGEGSAFRNDLTHPHPNPSPASQERG